MKKTLASGFLLFATFWGVNAQTVSLKFNPENGSKYEATVLTETKITQMVMGQTMDINSTNNVKFDYDFADAGENKQLSLTYKQLDVSVNAMGQETKLSSESSDAASSALKNIKGSVITATINSGGEVLDVKGADELSNGIDDAATKEIMKQLLSNDNIKSSIRQSLSSYPNKALKVGDSWTDSLAISLPYKMNIISTYTLQKIDGSESTIQIASKISSNGKQPFEAQGMSMEMSAEGTGTGSLVVDNATGVAKTGESNQSIDATVYAMGQEVPMKIDTVTKTTVNKK